MKASVVNIVALLIDGRPSEDALRQELLPLCHQLSLSTGIIIRIPPILAKSYRHIYRQSLANVFHELGNVLDRFLDILTVPDDLYEKSPWNKSRKYSVDISKYSKLCDSFSALTLDDYVVYTVVFKQWTQWPTRSAQALKKLVEQKYVPNVAETLNYGPIKTLYANRRERWRFDMYMKFDRYNNVFEDVEFEQNSLDEYDTSVIAAVLKIWRTADSLFQKFLKDFDHDGIGPENLDELVSILEDLESKAQKAEDVCKPPTNSLCVLFHTEQVVDSLEQFADLMLRLEKYREFILRQWLRELKTAIVGLRQLVTLSPEDYPE